MSVTFFVISIFAFLAVGILAIVGMIRKKPNPDDRPWHLKTRFWILGAAGVWAVSLIIAAAIPRPATVDVDADSGPADSAPSRYSQSWGKDYASTTCADWNGPMTDQQQFAAAADVLAAAWKKIEGSARFPSDALIEEFQSGITTACVVDTATITDISYGVYSTEPRFTP